MPALLLEGLDAELDFLASPCSPTPSTNFDWDLSDLN